MDKIQELKKRIYKHCPELKEPSLGCEVQSSDKGFKRFVVGRDTENDEMFYAEIDQVGSEDQMWSTDGVLPDKQILGHPIHLEHLLIAIQKSYFNCVYYPAMTGGVMKLNIQIPEREANYDLTKSFDQNCENPELVDFLLEVIN